MQHDPTDIDGVDQAHRDAETNAKLQLRIETEDLRWLVSNKRGRRIVHRMLARAGVHQLSFHTNALTMAFNEGRRSEGNALLARLVAAAPEQYTLMLQENQNG